MNQQNWNKLTYFEQLSNVDGEVVRMVRAHERYLSGEAKEDYGPFYLENAIKLIKMTLMDDKNAAKAYRAVELYDEIDILRQYLNGDCSAESVNSYWGEYTKAIS